MKTWSFIIVAAGKGTRLGGELKQFRILGGRPVWCWSAIVAEELYKQGLVEELILVVPAGMEEEVGNQAQNFELPVTVITGGPRRSDSVYAGLLASSSWGCLVHDAVRPFVKPGLCRRLMEAVMDGKGAIPVILVADALKRVLPDGKMTIVPREDLLATQTPQVFPREELLCAFDEHQDGFRDEAEAWIMAGKELVPVRGAKLNFKITDAQDWELASAIVEGGEVMRVGNGFDVHPLVPGRRLRLGGIEIPDAPLGLHGHSDADVVAHAVADALLGAAGESDIGTLFPANDDTYKGANSMELLKQVVDLISSEGWSIEWVDATLQAQIPRLADKIEAIRRSLESALQLGQRRSGRVANIKVKSGESVGSVGRGECLICHATATVARRPLGWSSES